MIFKNTSEKNNKTIISKLLFLLKLVKVIEKNGSFTNQIYKIAEGLQSTLPKQKLTYVSIYFTDKYFFSENIV